MSFFLRPEDYYVVAIFPDGTVQLVTENTVEVETMDSTAMDNADFEANPSTHNIDNSGYNEIKQQETIDLLVQLQTEQSKTNLINDQFRLQFMRNIEEQEAALKQVETKMDVKLVNLKLHVDKKYEALDLRIIHLEKQAVTGQGIPIPHLDSGSSGGRATGSGTCKQVVKQAATKDVIAQGRGRPSGDSTFNKRAQCVYCTSQFATSYSLKQHVKKTCKFAPQEEQSPDPKKTCEFCDKTLGARYLRQHAQSRCPALKKLRSGNK